MSQFDVDLAENLGAMAEARASLLACLQTLSDDQVDVARRGAWSVRAVICVALP
jgi:hypothetical protein